MKVSELLGPSSGLKSAESVATFVVVESGTCQVPVMTSPLPEITPRSHEQDDDYMTEVYSYPLHDSPTCDEQFVNMRVDIKVKVSSDPSAPPTTPAEVHPQGGSIAPPSTPTNSLSSMMKNTNDDCNQCDSDVIDGGYSNFSRLRKSTLRNRSAPPVVSQYRTRLATTSQWIKKRAVAELTSSRNLSRRPGTSVRPFSEREVVEVTNPQLSRISIEPIEHPPLLADTGSFKGRTPISMRPSSFRSLKQQLTLRENHGAGAQETTSSIDHAIDKPASNNKVDQYVTELRKSIKMRKPGLNGKKRMTPFAVWAISNTDGPNIVSPELEKIENDIRPTEHVIDVGNIPETLSKSVQKTPESHPVKKEVIRQINVPEVDEPRRKSRLEVRGDHPPAIEKETKENGHIATEDNSTMNAFPRSKTTLSYAAKRGTKRYAKQFVIRADLPPFKPQMLDKDFFRPRSGLQSSDKGNSNSRTLPYIKLRQTVTDYQTYKQNSAPFVRTLI